MPFGPSVTRSRSSLQTDRSRAMTSKLKLKINGFPGTIGFAVREHPNVRRRDAHVEENRG